MKKIFLYIFISLFLCTASFAKILHFKCIEKYSGYNADENQIGSDTLLLLQIDTKKKLIREWSDFSNLFHPEWEITKITNYNYYSKKPVGYNDSEIDFTTRASFNRYTGSFTSRLNKDKASYVYNCQPTSQLY